MQIYVNDNLITNVMSASVLRSVLQFVPTFTFTMPDAFGNDTPFLPQSNVKIYVDGELIFTGYIDAMDIEQTPTGTLLTYSGRSKTQDIYDCSAFIKGYRLKNKTPAQIARILCKQVGVGVVIEKDGNAIPEFAITAGDSIYDCLLRACNPAGIQLLTNEHGEIVLAQAINEKKQALNFRFNNDTPNVINRARSIDYSDLYSDYKAVGQQGGGTYFGDQDAAKYASGTTADENIQRNRLLVMHAEDQATSAELKKRVQYEKNQRLGNADTITYDVAGFANANGVLYCPYRVVDVKDDYLRASALYVIDSVVFEASATDGRTTTLTLIPPMAFGFEPVRQRKKTNAAGTISLLDQADSLLSEFAKNSNAGDVQ